MRLGKLALSYLQRVVLRRMLGRGYAIYERNRGRLHEIFLGPPAMTIPLRVTTFAALQRRGLIAQDKPDDDFRVWRLTADGEEAARACRRADRRVK